MRCQTNTLIWSYEGNAKKVCASSAEWGETMKIDDLIEAELKNAEFAAAYREEGKLLDVTLARYQAREAAGLAQGECATSTSVDHCKH